jgi:hypothetical protein
MSPATVQAAVLCAGVDEADDDACVPPLEVADGDPPAHAATTKSIPAAASAAGNR